jgi:adenosylcobinamide-GDP ribazoletransferase
MAKDVTGMGGITTDLKTGLAFCTRLPITAPMDSKLTQAAWTFPLVGALVGAAGAIVYWLAAWSGLPPFVGATLAVGATALLTGCLHEDGLADTADGFGGGSTKERKLEIMRDSRSGTYGVIALILSFMLRAGATASLAASAPVAAALIAAHAGGRAAMPLFMATIPHARQDGLSAGAGTPQLGRVAIAALLGLLALLLCLGVGAGLLAALFVMLVLVGMARLTLRQIGGQTGDVIGAVEQISEIVILLTAAALL